MADLTITVPDPIAPRLLDAIAGKHGYNPAGGQTKKQFAERQMKLWLRDQLETYEAGLAQERARQEAIDAIRDEMPDE
jgi:hypothetical protein